MPIDNSVTIAYHDVYPDFEDVDPAGLSSTVPTKMALALICHFTAQLHTLEEDSNRQVEILHSWTERFPLNVKAQIAQKVATFNQEGNSHLNFFNTVSSLFYIEFLLAHPNALQETNDLTPIQEENLFKLYLFQSSLWTKEQENFIRSQVEQEKPVIDWILALMAPYNELFEFKDFRLQFIKAIYFFKFCEKNTEFNQYLTIFLQTRNIPSWQEYLIQLLTMYVGAIEGNSLKTVIQFTAQDMNVFQSLASLFITAPSPPARDFLQLRKKPLYRFANNELLVLSENFLVDKLFQAVLFDLGDALVQAQATYQNKTINSLKTFLTIFARDFVEQHLFYRLMEFTFKKAGYKHYNGEALKAQFGDGTPDYILIDKHKVYVIEFKNALFSAHAKYSYDPVQIQQELRLKFITGANGSPKGVTQLTNVLTDVANERYDPVFNELRSLTFYPIIITTDYSFNLPTINQMLANVFSQQITDVNLKNSLTIKPLTLIDLDSIIKFQDLFKTMRLSLHRELDGYQNYLSKGKDAVDRAVSFHRYIHDATKRMKYYTPTIFFTEVARLLPIINNSAP